jgi:Na+-translocating ferredoxin:NAD+ oxidoreductase RnfE subunit
MARNYGVTGRENLIARRGPFAQAALDSISVLFGTLFVVSLVGSLPLAVFLMFFASF